MQVHQSTRIPHFSLSGIDELSGKVAAVSDIGGASTPSEFALLVLVLAQSCLVASAVEKIPTVTSPGDGMDDTGRANSVDKGGFPASSY